MLKIYILLFISLYCIFTIIYIYIKEKQRIYNIIHKCNSPITNIQLTFSRTYLLNKNKLFIKIFSPTNIIIHEIAHSISNSLGHTNEFNTIYNNLLLQYQNNL